MTNKTQIDFLKNSVLISLPYNINSHICLLGSEVMSRKSCTQQKLLTNLQLANSRINIHPIKHLS